MREEDELRTLNTKYIFDTDYMFTVFGVELNPCFVSEILTLPQANRSVHFMLYNDLKTAKAEAKSHEETKEEAKKTPEHAEARESSTSVVPVPSGQKFRSKKIMCVKRPQPPSQAPYKSAEAKGPLINSSDSYDDTPLHGLWLKKGGVISQDVVVEPEALPVQRPST